MDKAQVIWYFRHFSRSTNRTKRTNHSKSTDHKKNVFVLKVPIVIKVQIMLAANCNGHGPKNRLVHRCMPNYIMLTKDTVRAIYYLCNLWLLSIMPNQCDAGIFQTVLRDSIYRGWETSTQ